MYESIYNIYNYFKPGLNWLNIKFLSLSSTNPAWVCVAKSSTQILKVHLLWKKKHYPISNHTVQVNVINDSKKKLLKNFNFFGFLGV